MKYFLCFFEGDGGDRESSSVYQSELVIAQNEDEALQKYFNNFKFPVEEKQKSNYSVIEMKPIQ